MVTGLESQVLDYPDENWKKEAEKYDVPWKFYSEVRLILAQADVDEDEAKILARRLAGSITAEELRGGVPMTPMEVRELMVNYLDVSDDEKERIKEAIRAYRKKRMEEMQAGASLVFSGVKNVPDPDPEEVETRWEPVQDLEQVLIGDDGEVVSEVVQEDTPIQTVKPEEEKPIDVGDGVGLAKATKLKRLKNLEKKKRMKVESSEGEKEGD